MEYVRAYYAGETISFALTFDHGDGVKAVAAIFVHEDDHNRVLVLSGGAPSLQATAAGGVEYWQTTLSRTATAADKTGVYVCVGIRAEYEDGVRADFDNEPDHITGLRFRLERRNRPKPLAYTWNWGAG